MPMYTKGQQLKTKIKIKSIATILKKLQIFLPCLRSLSCVSLRSLSVALASVLGHHALHLCFSAVGASVRTEEVEIIH